MVIEYYITLGRIKINIPRKSQLYKNLHRFPTIDASGFGSVIHYPIYGDGTNNWATGIIEITVVSK